MVKLIYIYAKTCPACKIAEQHLEKMKNELNLEVEKVDIDSKKGLMLAIKVAKEQGWDGIPVPLLLNEKGEYIASGVSLNYEKYKKIIIDKLLE